MTRIGRRQFLKNAAAGAVFIGAPYLLLSRKTVHAQAGPVPAFIGAEGFGAQTTHARSSSAKILFVTNLNDSGPGSFRQAYLQTTGPRYIIFRVAGYIDIPSQLRQEGAGLGNVYVAGQSAPPDGITFRAAPTVTIPNGGNVFIREPQTCFRHVRFRQRHSSGLNTQCLTIWRYSAATEFVIVDHCSASFSHDDCMFSNYHNLTIQRCLLGETFGRAFLFDSKSQPPQYSFHHNYMMGCSGRQPSAAAQGQVVNNLHYNWGGFTGLCMEYYTPFAPINVDVVNCYSKWGPTSGWGNSTGWENPDLAFEIVHGNLGFPGFLYLSGNRALLPTQGEIASRVKWTAGGAPLTFVGSPHHNPTVPVTVHAAADLPAVILPDVGCTKPVRDPIDTLQVGAYAAFTGKSAFTLGGCGYEACSMYAETHGGDPWPPLASGTPLHLEPSGMTQEFITRNGLTNTVASALSTSLSESFDNVYQGINVTGIQNIEWNLMEKAGDVALTGTLRPPKMTGGIRATGGVRY